MQGTPMGSESWRATLLTIESRELRESEVPTGACIADMINEKRKRKS